METVSINSIVILVSVVLGLYAALMAAILGILSALWLRMGSIQQEFGELKAGVAAVREQVAEVGGEIVAVEGRMERRHRELEEQMERNHNQLMRAILAHSHRPDGRPTFDMPPDFEPTPSDN